jgi:rhamnogalacturonyl hydrolase YesR
VNAIVKTTRAWIDSINMNERARIARRLDRQGLPEFDPGPQRAITEGLSWLCYAQDKSATRDGGVARHFSLLDGWGSSYPETTGYIAETFLSHGAETANTDLINRALRMLDWLVSIQFPEGCFQGGMVDELPKLPAVFDTGQILTGLAAGTRSQERFRAPMIGAADWLVKIQSAEGGWEHDTPFAAAGAKVYETHVAIGLFRAAVFEPTRGYLEAAKAQVDWALGHQTDNGWLANCCLTDQTVPLTHTIGYALRGILEAYLATREVKYRDAACLTADGLLGAMSAEGKLPGRLTEHWLPASEWVCLTGTAQIAECLWLLFEFTGNDDYKRGAQRANSYVRRTIDIAGPPETHGGVKGSFPVDGWYGKWQYLNWACKFMIDANRAELRIGS